MGNACEGAIHSIRERETDNNCGSMDPQRTVHYYSGMGREAGNACKGCSRTKCVFLRRVVFGRTILRRTLGLAGSNVSSLFPGCQVVCFLRYSVYLIVIVIVS